MSSQCYFHNNTGNTVYIDVYRVNKHPGGPTKLSGSLTWEQIRAHIEAAGFNELRNGADYSGPWATLSWNLDFGGYEISATDAQGRPTEIRVFSGRCYTGATANSNKRYELDANKTVTHTIYLTAPSTSAPELNQLSAPHAQDFNSQAMATGIVVGAAFAVGLMLKELMYKSWSSPPPPPPPAASSRVCEVSSDRTILGSPMMADWLRDLNNQQSGYAAPPPSYRTLASSTTLLPSAPATSI